MRYLTTLVLGLTAFLWSWDARADYKFNTENSFEAQKRLFEDIRTGHVDTKNVGPHAIEAITKESIFSATPAKLNQLGSISQICLFVGIKYPTSRALAFRTFHQNGCGDWVITTEVSPETLTGIVLVPVKLLPGRTDACGPPGVIPPVPAGGDSFTLPGNLKCRRVDDLSPPKQTDELAKACGIISGFCK
jgi:hypothetical protein